MDWLGCQNLLLYSLNFDFKLWLWASEPLLYHFNPKLHNLLLLWTDQGIPDLPQWLTKKKAAQTRETLGRETLPTVKAVMAVVKFCIQTFKSSSCAGFWTSTLVCFTTTSDFEGQWLATYTLESSSNPLPKCKHTNSKWLWAIYLKKKLSSTQCNRCMKTPYTTSMQWSKKPFLGYFEGMRNRQDSMAEEPFQLT